MKKIFLSALFVSGVCFSQELIVDPSFNPGGSGLAFDGFNGVVYDSELLSDGRIVVAGSFDSYNGTAINNIALLHPDGTLDTSFNPGSGTDYSISAVEIDTNDKIYIGGYFLTYNGAAKKGIARLNTDGSLDTGFNVSFDTSIMYPDVHDIEVVEGGKVYIGGDFLTTSGDYALTRRKSNGAVDASFGSDFSMFNEVSDLFLQEDGGLLIAGYFEQGFLFRINPDETWDGVFNNNVECMGVCSTVFGQADGKVIIAGAFGLNEADFMGGNFSLLARLNSDGTTDGEYNSYPLFSGPNNTESVYNINAYQDKLLLCGNIHVGDSFSPVVFLNSNGEVSETPSVGSGVAEAITVAGTYNKRVFSSLVLPDNKILLGGFFGGFNGVATSSFIRIGDAESMGVDDFLNNEVYVYKNGVVVFESLSEPISDIQIYDLSGKLVCGFSNIDNTVYTANLVVSSNIYVAKINLSNNRQAVLKFAY